MGERRFLKVEDLPTELGGLMAMAYDNMHSELSLDSFGRTYSKNFKLLVTLGIFEQIEKSKVYALTELGCRLLIDGQRRWLSDPRNFPANVTMLWDDAPIKRAEMPKAVNAYPMYQTPAVDKSYKSPKQTEAEKKLAAWNAKVLGKPIA